MKMVFTCIFSLLLLTACKETARDEAPPTFSITNIRIQPASGPAQNTNPSSSPIAISKVENTLSVAMLLRDNEALKGYSFSISPKGALGAGNPWTVSVTQDTLSGTERILPLVNISTTNAGLAAGPYQLKISCTDRAGNTSTQFVQDLQLN